MTRIYDDPTIPVCGHPINVSGEGETPRECQVSTQQRRSTMYRQEQRLCHVIGCTEPAVQDADECRPHLEEWEREEAKEGRTAAPCAEGHYECAHHSRGACHAREALAAGYAPECPSRNPKCIWTEKPSWLEEEA